MRRQTRSKSQTPGSNQKRRSDGGKKPTKSLCSKNSKLSQKTSKASLHVTDQEEFLIKEIERILAELKRTDDGKANVETLDNLKKLITTTTGFESLPKTLKILMGHYVTIKELYNTKTDAAVKKRLASLVSFVATSRPPNSEGDVLRFFLLSDQERVNTWGIAFVRDLNKDIIEQWKVGSDKENKAQLSGLVLRVAQYYIEQNSEIDACDLLIETDQLDQLQTLVNLADVCAKICRYITSCSPCLPEPENKNALYCAINLWLKFDQYVEALLVAIHLQSPSIIEKIFRLCKDVTLQKQMAFILVRHNLSIDSKCANPEAAKLLANSPLSEHFLAVAKQLDILAPKAPDDVIKPSNQGQRNRGPFRMVTVPVAVSFMNGFINAAFGSDKLLLGEGDSLAWIKQHKDLEMISTIGSLGLLCLWDVNGLNKIDKYLNSSDQYMKAGALIASGLVSCTAKCDFDPAYLTLNPYVNNPSNAIQLGAIVGLGLAYVGTNHAEAIKTILSLIRKDKTIAFTVSIGALSCGLIANSSADGTLISSLIELLSVRFCDINSKTGRCIIHAIGLCAMGKVEMLPTLLEAIQVVPSLLVRNYLKLFIEVCAYVGSSNILKVQELVQLCAKVQANQAKSQETLKSKTHKGKRVVRRVPSREVDPIGNLTKMTAVLGVGLISIADDLNSQMILRNFGHLLQVGDDKMKSATIMAIALMYLSNPQMNIIDLLTKYVHDESVSLASCAILALGMISAGTNNAKVAKVLADLSYFPRVCRQSLIVLAIKVAQGLLHLGKGSLTLNPRMEGRLVRHSSISGVLLLMLQLLHNESALVQQHYSLFFLACAIRPKMMITLDCDTLQPVSVPVRVGQPVDTTGQAGNPRTVTGFQTFTTPVLLSTNESAELACDNYIPLSSHLEGFVLLKRKPEPKEVSPKTSAASKTSLAKSTSRSASPKADQVVADSKCNSQKPTSEGSTSGTAN